jgi:hypothetical protein
MFNIPLRVTVVESFKRDALADVFGLLPARISFDGYFLSKEELGKLMSGEKPELFIWWDALGYDENNQLVRHSR